MPVRDARQDESWKILRGIDSQFIREATLQRAFVAETPATSQHFVPRFFAYEDGSQGGLAEQAAGIQDKIIRSDVLKNSCFSIQSLQTNHVYVRGLASQVVVVNGAYAMGELDQILNIELQNPTSVNGFFTHELLADEIRKSEQAIQELKWVLRYQDQVGNPTSTGVSNQWSFNFLPTYRYNQEGNVDTSIAGTRRNLEAIRSYACRDTFGYTGSLTQIWNYNRPESFYSYAYLPWVQTITYQDLQGVQHTTTGEESLSILSQTAADNQLVLQFLVEQDSPVGNLTKVVFVPVSCASLNVSNRAWVPDFNEVM